MCIGSVETVPVASAYVLLCPYVPFFLQKENVAGKRGNTLQAHLSPLHIPYTFQTPLPSPRCQLACAHQVRDHLAVALRVVGVVALRGRLQVLVVVDLAVHLADGAIRYMLCVYIIIIIGYIIMCIHTNR